MATFFDGNQLGYWGAQPMYGRLTGDVGRSGNTVTLSNLQMTLWATNAWGTDPNSWQAIRDGGTELTRYTGPNFASGTASYSFSDVSFGVGASDTSRQLNVTTSDGFTVYFTVTFPAGTTPPSGGWMSWVSSTWDSVTIQGSVSDWGNGGNPSRHFAVLDTSAVSDNWNGVPRREKFVDGSSTSVGTVTVSNSSYDADYDGGIDIKGCLSYKVGMWYGTDYGSSATGDYSTRYLPPSPLSVLTISQVPGPGGTSIATVSVAGGDSTNNYSETVSTEVRYSIDSEVTWSSWTTIGSGLPWATQTTTLSIPYATPLVVEARQVFHSQYSEVKSSSTPGIRPPLYGSVNGYSKSIHKLYGSVNGHSKNIIKLYGSVNGQSKRIF